MKTDSSSISTNPQHDTHHTNRRPSPRGCERHLRRRARDGVPTFEQYMRRSEAKERTRVRDDERAAVSVATSVERSLRGRVDF